MRLRLKGCEDAVAESANAPADMLSKGKNANTTASAVTGVKHASMKALDESGNPIFFATTSTGGTHCAEGRQITTLASCREAAKQLKYTWGGTNAQTYYQDGCSVDSASVWFNTNVRVGGGPVLAAHTTICLVQTGASDPTGSADDLANGNAMESQRKTDDAAVSKEELAEMTDEQTVEACKTMVGQCNCGAWETQKTGDLNLRYACHDAKCCMFKLSSGGDTTFQYCNDDSFCDNDSSFHAVVNDEGDANEWFGSSQLAKDSSAAAAYLNPGPAAVTKTASFGVIHGPWSTPMQWVSKTFKLDKHVGMRVVARLWVIGTGTNTGSEAESVEFSVDGVVRKRTIACRDTLAGCAGPTGHMANGGCSAANHLHATHWRPGCLKTCGYCESSYNPNWDGVAWVSEPTVKELHGLGGKHKDVSYTQLDHTATQVTIKVGSNFDQDLTKMGWGFSGLTILVRSQVCDNTFASKFALNSHKVGTGLCNGNLIRVYNSDADNPGTTILESREACASACANKKTPASGSPTQWDVHPGVVHGFAIHRGSDTGRCYCEMQVCEGLSAK